MSRYDKAPFNKNGHFTARRAFTYNGKRYAVGDKFDWRKIACSPRKLSNLYDGNFLTLDEGKKPKKAKKADAPKAWKKPKKAKKVEDAPEVKEDDADIEEFLNDQD